jgi:hypothetical protein
LISSSLGSKAILVLFVMSVFLAFSDFHSVSPRQKANASPGEDWRCTPELQGDGVSTLPVCVSASPFTLIPLASSLGGAMSVGAMGAQVMPPCESGGSPKYCIRRIAISGSGSDRALSFVGDDPRLATTNLEGFGLNGSEELGIPPGGKTSFWKDPLTGDLFFVSIVTWYRIGVDLDKPTSQNLNANVYRTDAMISKVSKLPELSTALDDFRAIRLSPDTRFEMSLSFPDGWGGFTGARIADLAFSVTKQRGFSLLSIAGKPIEVSGANVLVRKPSTEWDYILGNSYPANGASAVSPVPYISMADSFQSLTQDRATGSQMIWGFNLYPSQIRCGSERVDFPGYSASNALFQDSSVPVFSGGFFTYRAGDFHRKQDGSINRGVYLFGIDSDLARCLYGFTQAPISASISVTNEDGEREIAVTRVYTQEGLLRLEATNFTYSVKTIRTKIIQSPSKAVRVKSFASCKALNKEFRGGVAKSKSSKNLGLAAKFKPSVNRKLYSANSQFDIDRDGIACEK